MLREISSPQLTEWQAYERLEPFNDVWAVLYGAAMVCATVANVHRDRKARAYTPADFMPRFGVTEADLRAEQEARTRTQIERLKTASRVRPPTHTRRGVS